MDLPWLSSLRTETLRKTAASLSLLTNQRCPSKDFNTSVSFASIPLGKPYDFHDQTLCSCLWTLYQAISSLSNIDGKQRPDLNKLSSSQMFIIISFTERLRNLNYRTMLLWQGVYRHGTWKWSLLPKYWARERQDLKILSPLGILGTTEHCWLLFVLMYWQAFWKSVAASKRFKEEFEEHCRDVMALLYKKSQWNPMGISALESTKWLKISQADHAG